MKNRVPYGFILFQGFQSICYLGLMISLYKSGRAIGDLLFVGCLLSVFWLLGFYNNRDILFKEVDIWDEIETEDGWKRIERDITKR